MLEKLAHYNGILPPDQHFITIDIPASISYEVVTKDSLPGWDDIDGAASRTYGAAWIDKARSGILFVPSIVSREESNVVINPGHSDAARIRPGREQPVRWDKRLFDN
jgi:RES domain-containing protein